MQQIGAQLRCPHCGHDHPREARACPMTGRPMPGALQPGQVLDGKYRIVRHIADGGMGAVYEAEHLLIGKRVAVKSLHPALASDNVLTARFHQEARAASAIGHEHIVDMQDMGRAPDGALFIVMELLRGQNLADRLRSLGGRMPVPRAAHVMKQVLEALAAAHRIGIVHRDLKPENIFLIHRGNDPDFVKVVDFGISKVIGDPQAKMQNTGFVLGTPYYMAPEQARGGPVDHRADIYACGVMLYQLITGQLPYTAPNFNALMFAIASGQYTRPRQLAPEVPPEFEQVVMYAMALDPGNRYQTAEHLVQTLAQWGQPVAAPPPPYEPPDQQDQARTPSAVKAFMAPPPDLGIATPVPRGLMPTRRRRRALPITIGLGVAVGVCVGLVIIRGTGKKPEETKVVTPPPVEKQVEPPPTPTPTPTPTPPPEPEAKPPEPQLVTFSITPPEAASAASITIDGSPITGTSAPIEFKDGYPVRVVVKAPGYVTFDKKIDPGTTAVEIKLKKRGPSGPSGKIQL